MKDKQEQIGGTHYEVMKIQPIDYIMANGLDFCQGSVCKYISRYRNKGKDEDIKKIIHFCKIILSKEFGYTQDELKSL